MNTDALLRSVRVVAEKDFRDAIKSRALLILGAVFVVFFASAAFFFADQVSQALQNAANASNGTNATQAQQVRESLNSDAFLGTLTQITRLLIPLTGIVVSYAALVGERESGTMKLLLSLPHSRLSVVLGKLLGRSGVVAVPVLLGFLVAAPVFPILGVTLEPVGFLAFALATALVGIVFVAISLGASAAASTARRAVVGVVGLYVLFTLLWGQFSNAVFQRIAENTDLGNEALIQTFLVIRHINPVRAYESLVASVGPQSPLEARTSVFSGFQGQIYAQALQQGDGLPVYLTDPALVIYLLLWIVVPVALGYWAFERADL
ncbi:ABC transporter permease subunit [Salinirubellus sp. GCM10025818]|uniref:ABC transporter permease subunit n=1 Tax=Salinirubellus TaxID=2162630 RepID=UPI0030CE4AEC